MNSKITAKVVPFSSVTGGGITLHDETGRVLALMPLRDNRGDLPDIPSPDQAERFKTEYVAFCERIAAAINAGQPERQVRHLKKGQVYDVMAGEGLFQVSLAHCHGQDGRKGRMVYDGDPVTVYRNLELGMTFVRFPDEVEDPARFEQLDT